MYVACPSCKSLYQISAEQLRRAGGTVRCGQCQTQFDTANAVFEDPQQALAYEPPLKQELAQEIDDLVGRALDEVSGEGVSESGQAEAGASTAPCEAPGPRVEATDGMSEEFRADVDVYAQPVSSEFTPWVLQQAPPDEESDLVHSLMFHDEGHAYPRTGWGAIAAALVLTLALVVQYAYWDRYRLVQISALRPAMEALCGPLGCDLPLRHDLARLEMVEREVRDHPRVDDALLVSAAFINRASFMQAYPVLQISFSDMAGTPVAVRRFTPEQYLRKKKAANGMAPGEQTLVMLEVVDPGERAVSFQFDFM